MSEPNLRGAVWLGVHYPPRKCNWELFSSIGSTVSNPGQIRFLAVPRLMTLETRSHLTRPCSCCWFAIRSVLEFGLGTFDANGVMNAAKQQLEHKQKEIRSASFLPCVDLIFIHRHAVVARLPRRFWLPFTSPSLAMLSRSCSCKVCFVSASLRIGSC